MRAGMKWGSLALAVSLMLGIRALPAVAGQSDVGDGLPDNGFSQSGPWNTRLPANVPLASNSAAIVANIAQDEQDTNGAWGLNTDTYSTPVFYVGRNTPVQDWTYSDCQNMPQLAPVIAGSLRNVPTPADLIASQGTDAVTTIYQPSTDTYWDFWRAQEDASGHWSACWGGKIEHYSQNPGIFSNPLGASASGLPLGAGLIISTTRSSWSSLAPRRTAFPGPPTATMATQREVTFPARGTPPDSLSDKRYEQITMGQRIPLAFLCLA